MSRGVWTLFAAYCLLAGSGWLMPAVAPWVRGLVYLVVGLAAVGVNGRIAWAGWADIARLAVVGAMVSSVPDAMVGWAQGHVHSGLWTAVLAAVPAMVVFVVAQRSETGTDGSGVWRLLAPALVGLGGALLLIPIDLPQSSMGRMSLAVMVLCALSVAMAGVAIHRMLQSFRFVQAVAVFCIANAPVLLFGAGWSGGSRLAGSGAYTWIAALTIATEVLLLVALLRGMKPVRLAGRLLVVPLLTIVEGYILLRPELTARTGIGAALLAGSATMVLVSRGSEQDAGLSLR